MKKVQKLFLVAALILFGVCGHNLAVAQETEAPEKKLEWDIYGKVIFDGFYTSASQADGRKDGFDYNLVNLSRLGVNLEYGNFSGAVEFGASLSSIIRQLYAQYNFENGGSLLIGQTSAIAFYNFGQMSMGQNCLIDYGTLNDVRRPMLKYSMHGFNLAVMSGQGLEIMGMDYSGEFFNGADGVINVINGVAADANASLFEWIPRFEVSYDIASDVFNGLVFASYAPYIIKTKNAAADYKNYNVNTFSVGFGGQFDIGKAFIHVTAYYGMNLTLTNKLFNPLSPGITVEGADNKVVVQNVQSAGGAIGFGYAINDMITPQIGAGFSSSFGGPIAKYDDAYAVFANVVIQVNDWLSVTPEIAFMDKLYDGNGNRQSNTVVAGAQVEIIF